MRPTFYITIVNITIRVRAGYSCSSYRPILHIGRRNGSLLHHAFRSNVVRRSCVAGKSRKYLASQTFTASSPSLDKQTSSPNFFLTTWSESVYRSWVGMKGYTDRSFSHALCMNQAAFTLTITYVINLVLAPLSSSQRRVLGGLVVRAQRMSFPQQGAGLSAIRKKVNYILTLRNSKYMSRSACIDQNSMKKSQRFWRVRKVNIRTSSHEIVKRIVGIKMTCRSRKGMEKLNSIDDILNQARPCENFTKRIVFWTEINIYNGIIYCLYNRRKVFSPPNIKQCGELVAVHTITLQALPSTEYQIM
jgi:hypothetical protein